MSLRFLVTKLLILTLPVLALQASGEEIRVELTTRVQLAPAYLCRIQGDNSHLKPAYLNSLREVMTFDLKHCGYSKIMETDENLEKAVLNSDPNVAFNCLRWEKSGAHFVIKGEANANKLNLFALNVKTGSLKKFEDIPLTGDLHFDRQKMHNLADAVTKALFGVTGVASSKILYSVQDANPYPSKCDWTAEIWQCDYDGENTRKITNEKNYCITPTFIPSHPDYGHDRYLYVNYKNGQPKIYYSSVNSLKGKSLLQMRGNQLLPAVSKQRDKLAFISDASGRADLFLQEIGDDGQLVDKPKQLFSYPRSTQASPTFSPDGSKIAFVSDKDGTPRIYVIDSYAKDNKRPVPLLLTKKSNENTCPNWSPDGTKLAYSAKTSGVRQIWIYDFAAKEERQLSSGPGNKENPCWAQDSLHLVFNSTDPESSELYLVNLNQTEAVKITSGSGRKHYPTWGTH